MYSVEWDEGEKMTVDDFQLETFLVILVENGFTDFVVRHLVAVAR